MSQDISIMQINSSSFNYVNKHISHYLNCEVCNLPVYNGKYHSICNHFRCQSCDTIDHKCNTPEAPWYPLENNAFITDILGNLEVYCLNKDYGCTEIIARSGYLKHLNECKYSRLICANCLQKINKNNIKKHQDTECPNRMVTCKYCGLLGMFENIQKHETDINLCTNLDIFMKFLEHPMVVSTIQKINKRKMESDNDSNKKPKIEETEIEEAGIETFSNYHIKDFYNIIIIFLKTQYLKDKNVVIGMNRSEILTYIKDNIDAQYLSLWNHFENKSKVTYERYFYTALDSTNYVMKAGKCNFRNK